MSSFESGRGYPLSTMLCLTRREEVKTNRRLVPELRAADLALCMRSLMRGRSGERLHIAKEVWA